MKISTTLGSLLGLSALLAMSCSANNDKTADLRGQSSQKLAKVSAPKFSEAEQAARTAFDPKLAGQGEAVLQPVTPELERQLEASYRASLKQKNDKSALVNPAYPPTREDFDRALETIRNTKTPARAPLIQQYVEAAHQVSDTDERTTLLQRLDPADLNSLR